MASELALTSGFPSRHKEPLPIILLYPRVEPGQPDDSRLLGLPLSTLTLARALLKAGHDVRIIDQNVTPRVHDELAALPRPLFVGISCMGGEQIATGLGLAKLVARKWPGVPRIWGGWGPTLTPELYEHASSMPFVDAFVIGRGEVPVVEIAARLRDGKDFEGVPGTTWRKGAEIQRNPAAPLVDPHSADMLPYHLVHDHWNDYTTREGILNYVSAHGCPHRCGFCSIPVLTRTFNPTDNECVVRHLKIAKENYGIQSVVFFDDNFFTSKRRVIDLAQRMLDAQLHLQWHSNGRVDQLSRLTEDELAIIARSGCTYFNIGLETGDQETSDKINKDICVTDMYQVAERCRTAGIGLTLNFIMGLPGETTESLVRSLESLRAISARQPDMHVYWYIYMPSPGTSLWKEHVRDGTISQPTTLEELLRFGRYATEDVGFFTSPPPYRIFRMRQSKQQAVGWYFFHAYRPLAQAGLPSLPARLLQRWCRYRFVNRRFRLRFDWRLFCAARRGRLFARRMLKKALVIRPFYDVHQAWRQRRRPAHTHSLFSNIFGAPPLA